MVRVYACVCVCVCVCVCMCKLHVCCSLVGQCSPTAPTQLRTTHAQSRQQLQSTHTGVQRGPGLPSITGRHGPGRTAQAAGDCGGLVGVDRRSSPTCRKHGYRGVNKSRWDWPPQVSQSLARHTAPRDATCFDDSACVTVAVAALAVGSCFSGR